MDFSMYPMMVVPFAEGGGLDTGCLERMADMFHHAGCAGVVVPVQGALPRPLTEEERLLLSRQMAELCHARGMGCLLLVQTWEAWLEALRPDGFLLAGDALIAGENAADELRRFAGKFGADACLGVYESTENPLPDAVLQAMLEDGRFRLLVDGGSSLETTRRRLDMLAGTAVSLYSGKLAALDACMAAGAAGYCGSLLQVTPESFALLQQAYRQDRLIRARRMLQYLTLTAAALRDEMDIRYCLMKRGVFRGSVVLPESRRMELDALLAVNSQAYAQFLPHPPQQLLFRYDTAFPECHASTVLPLENGRVLAAYFAGTKEHNDDVGIWLSVREEESWRKPRLVAKVDQTPHWNPVLYATEAGVVLLFKVGKNIPEWRSYTMLSTDGGETWSKPQPMTTDHPANGPVRNKPLLLTDGRWLGPNSDEGDFGWLPRIDESTDGGLTFHRLAPIPINREDAAAPDYLKGQGAIQPTLWESAPGHVHALLRTTAGRIFRSDSVDGGRSWCTAYPTALPNNNSGIDLAQVEGRLYLVLNPVGQDWGYRTPLTVMVSEDNGATFRDFCTLEDRLFDDEHNRAGQFCYPAIAAKGRTLYITYTWNRKSIAFCQIELET